MTYIPDRLDPILEPLMGAVRVAERWLGPDDDWVEDDRRVIFQWAQNKFGKYHTFVKEKTDKEFIMYVDAPPDDVEVALMDHGPYQRNLASNRKYRVPEGGGRQWAVGSYVHDPSSTDWQHHVYLFPGKNGGTDVYGHRETTVREGAEHLTEPQADAEPHVLPAVMDDAQLTYHR